MIQQSVAPACQERLRRWGHGEKVPPQRVRGYRLAAPGEHVLDLGEAEEATEHHSRSTNKKNKTKQRKYENKKSQDKKKTPSDTFFPPVVWDETSKTELENDNSHTV